jgi:hypothetical protein
MVPASETKSSELMEMLSRLEEQMRRMQTDLDARLDAIAEGFEASRADDEAETLAAERIRSGATEPRETAPRFWRNSASTRTERMSEEHGRKVPVTFAEGVRDDVASLVTRSADDKTGNSEAEALKRRVAGFGAVLAAPHPRNVSGLHLERFEQANIREALKPARGLLHPHQIVAMRDRDSHSPATVLNSSRASNRAPLPCITAACSDH